MSIEISECANCVTGTTQGGRPHHCSYLQRPGTIEIFDSGVVNITQDGERSYMRLTVSELEELLAKAKARNT